MYMPTWADSSSIITNGIGWPNSNSGEGHLHSLHTNVLGKDMNPSFPSHQ